MNRSYSKIRHIQESNLILEKRLVSEYGAYPGFAKDEEIARNWYKQNANSINQVLQIGAVFIPIIGPFVSAGIGLADAAIYAKEGKTNEAGVATVFALLPGIGAVVSKIPGVKQLGQKGMQALATKVLTKAPLNAVEQGVVSGINLNKELVKQETNSVIKTMAANAAAKATNNTTKKVMGNIAKEGIEISAEEIAMNMASTNPVQRAVSKGAQKAAVSTVAKNVQSVNNMVNNFVKNAPRT